MHRVPMRAVVGLVAVAALTLAACGSKNTPAATSTTTSTTTSGSSASATATATASSSTDASPSTDLTIAAVEAVDLDGKKVEVAGGGTAMDPAGKGNATCSGIAIGMAGALTGSNAALGQNILGGVKLALDKHNKANPNCNVELKQFDTEGNADKASAAAPQIVSDASIVGLVGPAFSGETQATGDIFHQAGLLSMTPSATRVSLTTNGWDNFFRGLANDAQQGAGDAGYLKAVMSAKKVCVVEDDSPYGTGLADVVKKSLGDIADASCQVDVKTGDKDFSNAVNTIKSAAPDAIFYAGYFPEGAPFAKQLVDSGVTATFMSGDGTNDPQFVKQAGSAAKGALLSCPCGPPPSSYATEYTAFNKIAPGVYSVEGYDLTTIILAGIDSGIKDRAALVQFVKTYSGQGVGRTYKWDDKGELSGTVPVWIYKVQ